MNQGNIEATGRYFHEDMVEEVPLPGQGPGLDGLKQVLAGIRSSFPDMHWTVEEQICEGDRVVIRFTWRGTHQGDFMGVPASGKPVEIWGMVIDRIEGDKIKSTRILMDSMGLMMQIGAVPAP